MDSHVLFVGPYLIEMRRERDTSRNMYKYFYFVTSISRDFSTLYSALSTVLLRLG